MTTSSEQYSMEDRRFIEILSIDGIPLQDNYRDQPLLGMFPNAETFPQFFQQNLVSDDRVLKLFMNNCHNNIRVFYYQLLRLGYQIKDEDGDNKKFITAFKRIVFNPEFQILFTQQTEQNRQCYNDFQFKRFFAQFLTLLDKQYEQLQDQLQIEEVISHFPIMDMVFIHILRSLLATLNINEQFQVRIPTQVIFEQLSNILGLKVTSYGNCWKFEDSDMFCYEENQNQIYLAYIPGNGQEYQEQEDLRQIQPQLIEQQSIQLQQSQYIHPDAIKSDSKIVYSIDGQSPKHVQSTIIKQHQRQSSVSQKDTPQFHKKQSNNHQQTAISKYSERQYQKIKNVSIHQHHNVYGNKHPSYNKPTTSQTQRSTYSRPTNSMISENYQFIDYLGVATTQKHRIPKKNLGQQIPYLNRNQNRINNYQNFLAKVDHKTVGESRYQQNNYYQDKRFDNHFANQQQQPSQKFQSKYKPPAYYNNQSYQYKQQNNYYKSNQSSSQSTAYKHDLYDKYQPANVNPKPFFKYRNVISTIQYQDEISTPPRYNQQSIFNPIHISVDFNNIYEQGKQQYPVRPVTKFHPVSPTPMPDFHKYQTHKQKQYRQNTSKSFYQRDIYSQSRLQSNQHSNYHRQYKSQYQPNRYNQPKYYSTYNQPNEQYYSKQNIFKPQPYTYALPNKSSLGDFDSDFTPSEILNILRSPNRDNISKIKQSMRGLQRGKSIPERINLLKSAIHSNDNEVRDQLYRNESRSQFQYEQKNKRSLGNRFDESRGFQQSRTRQIYSSLQRN